MLTANPTCVPTVEKLLDEDTQGIFTRELTVETKGSLVVSVERVSSLDIRREAMSGPTLENARINALHVVGLSLRNTR